MIVDSLKNISFYKNVSENIYHGLMFLNNASENIKLGEYIINNKVKAIVTEYETGFDFEKTFEAHRNVIDIQYPIIGLERVKWSCIYHFTKKLI
jgi:beta-galactosidase beta subunit